MAGSCDTYKHTHQPRETGTHTITHTRQAAAKHTHTIAHMRQATRKAAKKQAKVTKEQTPGNTSATRRGRRGEEAAT